MSRAARARAALAVACAVSLGAVGCGGGDDETTAEPPATTAETTSTTTAEPTTSPTSTTAGAEQGGVEPPEPEPEPEPAPGGGSAGQGSGGAVVPDTPENDVTPPAETPQGKFEQFCNENPEACG